MKRHQFIPRALCLAMLCGSVACSNGNAAPAAAVSPLLDTSGDPVAKEAREIFLARCVACHGAEGLGNGPASAALTPKPRNYTDSDWQSMVTDAMIEKVILEGGPSIGKSPIMPPNPDLQSKPHVLAKLREIVRAFRR